MANALMSPLRGEVVAVVVVTHRGRIGLLRRSMTVGSDRGRWHCVTGFLPSGVAAGAQAFAEVGEETGLGGTELESFVAGPVLRIADSRGGHWLVHSYRCEVAKPILALNWENDAVRWVSPAGLDEQPVVEWLPAVTAAVGVSEGSSQWDG